MYSMPFKVMRENRASLIEQVADGIRSAIAMGHYKAGDTLPNLHEMAEALDVSEIVTRRAVQQLTRDGLLNPRRGTGIAVCDTNNKTWRGHVLYIHCSNPEMYYHSVMSSVIVDQLHRSGMLVSVVNFSLADFSGSMEKVRAELAHVVTLAVLEGSVEEIGVLLSERKIPFFQCSGPEFKFSQKPVRTVLRRNDAAMSAFRDHCIACGVRKIMQVLTGPGATHDTESFFKDTGIRINTLCAGALPGFGTTEGIERGALQSMMKWLEKRKSLPDLIWFPDDFTARGALLALVAKGIRIPEDVQVVTWANKGLGPVFIKPLTRIEIDPRMHGESFAHFIMDYLEGRTGSPQLELVPEFILGETTRLLVQRR